jgi:DNA-binding MarR family transcriptional regulator
MDRTTLTAALKPLQRRGLIDVLTDPKDARSRLLKLTEEGLLLLQRALPIWTATHAQVDEDLGEGGSEALRQGMARIR